MPVLVVIEQEELAFRPHIESGKAHLLRLAEHLLEQAAGIALKGGAVRLVHVADQAGRPFPLPIPWEDDEAVEIGIEIHVALLDPDKSLDGGAVEHALVLKRLLQLGGGDGDILERAEYIGELQADEPDIFILHHPHDVLGGILPHIDHAFPKYMPSLSHSALNLVKGILRIQGSAT